MRRTSPCYAARTPVMRCPPRVMRCPPLSCCAQSQHPARPAERSKSGVPGFRDCARNDLVEPTTPRGVYHPAARRPTPVIRPTPPRLRHAPRVMQHAPRVMRRPPLSCCAQSQHPAMSVERFTSRVPGFRDYARNDAVEAATLGFRDYAQNDSRVRPAPRGGRPPYGEGGVGVAGVAAAAR